MYSNIYLPCKKLNINRYIIVVAGVETMESSINDLPYEIVAIILEFADLPIQQYKNVRAASKHMSEFIRVWDLLHLGATFRPSHQRKLIRINTQFASTYLAAEHALTYWSGYMQEAARIRALCKNMWDFMYFWTIDADKKVRKDPLIIYREDFGPPYGKIQLRRTQKAISDSWLYGNYERNNCYNYSSPHSTYRYFHSPLPPHYRYPDYEKTYKPFPLFGKKRYAGIMSQLTFPGRSHIEAVKGWLGTERSMEIVELYNLVKSANPPAFAPLKTQQCEVKVPVLAKKPIAKVPKDRIKFPKRMEKVKWNKRPEKNKMRYR